MWFLGLGILISQYLSSTAQGSGLPNLQCPHDGDGVGENNPFLLQEKND